MEARLDYKTQKRDFCLGTDVGRSSSAVLRGCRVDEWGRKVQ